MGKVIVSAVHNIIVLDNVHGLGITACVAVSLRNCDIVFIIVIMLYTRACIPPTLKCGKYVFYEYTS